MAAEHRERAIGVFCVRNMCFQRAGALQAYHRQDNSHNDNEVDGGGDEGKGNGNGSEDNGKGKGKDDGDGEDEGKENEDDKNEILGLSTWDLLEADFEHEAAA